MMISTFFWMFFKMSAMNPKQINLFPIILAICDLFSRIAENTPHACKNKSTAQKFGGKTVERATKTNPTEISNSPIITAATCLVKTLLEYRRKIRPDFYGGQSNRWRDKHSYKTSDGRVISYEVTRALLVSKLVSHLRVHQRICLQGYKLALWWHP